MDPVEDYELGNHWRHSIKTKEGQKKSTTPKQSQLGIED